MRLFRRRPRSVRAPLGAEVALVLALHGVVERIEDPVVQVNQLELAAFQRLVDAVRTRYEVVTLDDVAAALAGEGALPERALALTFDDGYRSVAEIVHPLLERHGLPYAVFVAPGLVESRARLATYVMRAALELTNEREVRLAGRRPLRLRSADEREAAAGRAARALRELPQPEAEAVVAELRALLSEAEWREADRRFGSEELMDWAELRRLTAEGVTVGSHTYDHVVLHARQPVEEIERQVRLSKQSLEERLGLPCRHFAYPHGTPRDLCPVAVGAVTAAGYSTGLMNVGGPVRHGMAPVLLPRMPVTASLPDEALDARRQLSHSKWYARTAPELGVG